MTRKIFLQFLAAALFAAPGFASEHSARTEILNRLDGLEQKLAGLAEATPADKFGWRPVDGVRSVSEVYMHIAAANYFIAGTLGASTPAGTDPRELEKNVTAKADVTAELKKSVAHARSAIQGVADANVGDPVKLFGRDATKFAAMLAITEHMSEHLGQSIAYARMAGVTPPWSQ